MQNRTGNARWNGTLSRGDGIMSTGSGSARVPYTVGTRFEGDPGSNPEELLGAAHAGCFSMALAAELGKAGFEPKSVETKAQVKLEKTGDGFRITEIHLDTRAAVPGVDDETFDKLAQTAAETCPLSRALAGPRIILSARRTEAD